MAAKEKDKRDRAARLWLDDDEEPVATERRGRGGGDDQVSNV